MAESGEVAEWQLVLDEVSKPAPSGVFGQAIQYVKSGMAGLTEASKRLANVPQEDIRDAIEYGTKIPGAVTGGSINLDVIEKFSRQFEAMNKTAQMAALKGLGSKALKIMPIIGVVFSGAFAIKNIIYGFVEYGRLSALSGEIDMLWYETLFADNINKKIEEFRDNPNKLVSTVKVCKSAKIFVDEAISAVANSVDFVKDFAFLILEGLIAAGSIIVPAGWGAFLGITSVDILLSVIIWIIEYYAEGAAMEKYDIALANVSDIAEQKIQSFSEIDPVNYDDWDVEDLYDYFNSSSS
jgi:hypothetical protein